MCFFFYFFYFLHTNKGNMSALKTAKTTIGTAVNVSATLLTNTTEGTRLLGTNSNRQVNGYVTGVTNHTSKTGKNVCKPMVKFDVCGRIIEIPIFLKSIILGHLPDNPVVQASYVGPPPKGWKPVPPSTTTEHQNSTIVDVDSGRAVAAAPVTGSATATSCSPLQIPLQPREAIAAEQ